MLRVLLVACAILATAASAEGGTVTFYSSTGPNTSGDSAFGSAASSSGGTHYENDLDSLSNGTKVYGLTFGSIDVDISLGGTGGPYSNAVIFWGSFTAAKGCEYGNVYGAALLNEDVRGDHLTHSATRMAFEFPL